MAKVFVSWSSTNTEALMPLYGEGKIRSFLPLGSRYAKPGLQSAKNPAHYKYKKNIAMRDSLVIVYPA